MSARRVEWDGETPFELGDPWRARSRAGQGHRLDDPVTIGARRRTAFGVDRDIASTEGASHTALTPQ